MSGTLVTNFVQPDLNTDLTLNQRNSTGNTVAIGALYAGQNANTPLAGATNPTIGSIQSANNYIQNYVFNTANGSFSSSDFTAYPNNGTDASGWVDMGITSNNYSQATYSITGRNEGYVIMSAPSGSGTSGNLVFGTDSTGAYNSIQVYTKGFAQSKANAVVTIDGASGAMSTLNTINVPNTFGFKNRLINGAMMIDQRNAGNSVTPSAASQYTVDRFTCTQTQASKLTYQQVTDAPSGFANSFKILTAIAATPSSSDQFRFGQVIEGFNCADLGWGTASAKTVTVSFWAKASIAGTYSVAIWNQGYNNYSYVSTVSLTTSWAQYSITVTGPTTGTWGTGTSGCIELMFDLGGGSSWATSTLNAWQSGGAPGYFKATGSVSLVSNAAATLNITGVQLEKGSTATSFDYRPYGTELALCQRYYEVSYKDAGIGPIAGAYLNATNYVASWNFAQQKRSSPTVALASGASWSSATPGIAATISGVAFVTSSAYWSNATAGNPFLTASAEL